MICGLKNDIPFINMLRALYIYHLYYMLVIPLYHYLLDQYLRDLLDCHAVHG